MIGTAPFDFACVIKASSAVALLIAAPSSHVGVQLLPRTNAAVNDLSPCELTAALRFVLCGPLGLEVGRDLGDRGSRSARHGCPARRECQDGDQTSALQAS